MCASTVDVQSAAAKIRRGKKERRRYKKTTGQKYNALSITLGGHNNRRKYHSQKTAGLFVALA